MTDEARKLSKEELARWFSLYCSYPPRVSWCGCGHCNVAAHIEAQDEEIARLKGRIEKLRERMDQIADGPDESSVRAAMTPYENYLIRTAQDAIAADAEAAK